MRTTLRNAVVSLVLVACGAVSGCSSDEEAPRAFENRPAAPVLEKDPVTGTVDFYVPAEGEKPVLLPGMDPAQTAIDWIVANGDLLGVPDARGTYVPVEASKDDDDGMAHVRLQQMAGGVEVWGVETIVTFDENGAVALYDGAYVPNLDAIAKTPPTVSEEAALAKAQEEDRARVAGALSSSQQSTGLVVLVDDDNGDPRLARHVVTVVMTDNGPIVSHTFVDALTGEILDAYTDGGEEQQQHQTTGEGFDGQRHNVLVFDDVGGFTMGRLPTSEKGPLFPGRYVKDKWQYFTQPTLEGPWDRQAINAMLNVERSERFYEDLKWSGPDDKRGLVWLAVRSPMERWNAYATWGYDDGSHQIEFSPTMDGRRSAVIAIDIVAHEFTHLVTSHTSKLVYRRQPGAINEAVSDIFGELVERRILGVTDAALIAGTATGDPLRDFRHPRRITTRRGAPPDHYSNVRTLPKVQRPHDEKNDNGFVHTNSLIVTNAFALMLEGGANDTSRIAVEKGIGWDKSQKLWWKTQRRLLTKRTSIRRLARVQIAMARKSKSGFSGEAVTCAWAAVGAVTPEWASSKLGVTCPTAETSARAPRDACTNKPDGTYCAEHSSLAGYVCRGGQVSQSLLCPPPNTQCRGATPHGTQLVCDL